MAVSVWYMLREGQQRLSRHGIGGAWLDAGLLLAHCVGTSRARLLAMPDSAMQTRYLRRFRRCIARRIRGDSVALIRRTREFYGRSFMVDQRVLIPRPETETLVEAVLARIDMLPNMLPNMKHELFDCCTGCGAIAITLALERDGVRVSAGDLSWRALAVARHNARHLLGGAARLRLVHSDLLRHARGTFDLIVCNPPYLTSAELRDVAPEVAREPAMALDGGVDGLEPTRRLAAQAAGRLRTNGYLVIEIASNRAAESHAILSEAGFTDIEHICDLSGRPRVICARREGVPR